MGITLMGRICQDNPKLSFPFLKWNDVQYTILYNDSKSLVGDNIKNGLVNDLHDSESGIESVSTDAHYSREELSTIHEFCISQCNSFDCAGKYKT
eukprot:2239697-Ditylum_brightwellii.AAC.1